MVYRVQVFHGGRWVWGVHDYTQEEANNRVKSLKDVGIEARASLYDPEKDAGVRSKK